MQSNPSSTKPRRSIVRSLLQRITKKKDAEKEYPDFLNVSAETDVSPAEFPEFFASMNDGNDDFVSSDK